MATRSLSPKFDIPDVSNTNNTISMGSDIEPIQVVNQQSSLLHGPVAILWDIENCPVPSDVRPEDVAGNIRMALRVHPVIKGAVTMFSAYGDFNAFPRRLREGCQRTGVKLVDVPNGRKDAADKAILVDMFLFALDNKPPSSIMLISGDVDFAPALHILGQRGYTIILAIPSRVGVSSALSNAGHFVWDWPSVARGEGFVPSKNVLPRGPDPAGYYMSFAGDNSDCQNEQETIVYRGCQGENGAPTVNQMYCCNSSVSREFGATSLSLAEYGSNKITTCSYFTSRSQSSPSCFSERPTGDQSLSQDHGWWVRPGDLQGLKGQLVRLLELSGGSLPLVRIPSEYLKYFGRPLYMAEYGAYKLVHLFNKMTDAFIVVGKGHQKLLCLRNSFDKQIQKFPSSPAMERKDQKGNSVEENLDMGVCSQLGSSSDDYSDDEKNEDPSLESAYNMESLENIRQEVQELLVCYSCPVPIGNFDALYQQRYKKNINYESFGVEDLEQLVEKLKDVVELCEDRGNKKFLVSSFATG